MQQNNETCIFSAVMYTVLHFSLVLSLIETVDCTLWISQHKMYWSLLCGLPPRHQNDSWIAYLSTVTASLPVVVFSTSTVFLTEVLITSYAPKEGLMGLIFSQILQLLIWIFPKAVFCPRYSTTFHLGILKHICFSYSAFQAEKSSSLTNNFCCYLPFSHWHIPCEHYQC